MITKSAIKRLNGQKGFSMPELLVVLLIISILVVLALPQLTASRRLFRFAGMQRQISASLTEARQEAVSQRAAVTFRYDNAAKRIIIYGGAFGTAGASTNKNLDLAGSGLDAADVIYGQPSGAPNTALSDTSRLTALAANTVNVTFQPDGSVLDGGNNPVNNAIFFYNNKNPQESAFAVSVLGAGGRVKVWRYSNSIKTYIE